MNMQALLELRLCDNSLTGAKPGFLTAELSGA